MSSNHRYLLSKQDFWRYLSILKLPLGYRGKGNHIEKAFYTYVVLLFAKRKSISGIVFGLHTYFNSKSLFVDILMKLTDFRNSSAIIVVLYCAALMFQFLLQSSCI